MPRSKPTLAKAKQVLKDTFGYDSFHKTQTAAIKSVLSGNDTFVLMPTGGGKSMCYQVPALVLSGTTVVVSPLIALMKDQVDGLKANGVAAEFLNSSLEPQEQAEIIQRLLAGELKLLYVSAERLVTGDFLSVLKNIEISLFAIDEAHCISSWGHDFRPDYTRLSNLKSSFPKTPIIALTATADAITRKDILGQLELDDPQVFVDSFDRPNISLTVEQGVKKKEKIAAFLEDKHGQSGIIYCLTRKQTEELADKLRGMGFMAASYHAGMSSAERDSVQKSFVRDKTQIICATIAFGMGIDKSNVRWVIHYSLPKNIEGYYQEIGRAGRDSATAHALLFYSYADVEMIKKFFLDRTQGALQQEKLERIKEYAEGVTCRRKTLLQYFGEEYAEDCGNCDVCAEPFPKLNGTEITKVVLEKVKQLNKAGKCVTRELVALLSRESDKVSFASWHFYLGQLKNQGILGVDFSEQALFVTELGEQVLAGERQVELVLLDVFIERQEGARSAPSHTGIGAPKPGKKKKDLYKDEYNNPLFEKLRHKRKQLAEEQNIPAYLIFSDATLLEMAHAQPSSKSQMLSISGIGTVKFERYGDAFLGVIRQNS